MQIAIFLQLLWAIAGIFWNLAGMDMLNQGEVLLEPLPSVRAIFLLLGYGILLLIFRHFKLKGFYKLVSLAGCVYASVVFFKAFSADPEFLSNQSWHWGGAFINLVGIFAGLVGVFGRSNTKAYNPDPISTNFDSDH